MNKSSLNAMKIDSRPFLGIAFDKKNIPWVIKEQTLHTDPKDPYYNPKHLKLNNSKVYVYKFLCDPDHYLNLSNVFAIPKEFLIPMTKMNSSSYAKRKLKEANDFYEKNAYDGTASIKAKMNLCVKLYKRDVNFRKNSTNFFQQVNEYIKYKKEQELLTVKSKQNEPGSGSSGVPNDENKTSAQVYKEWEEKQKKALHSSSATPVIDFGLKHEMEN